MCKINKIIIIILNKFSVRVMFRGRITSGDRKSENMLSIKTITPMKSLRRAYIQCVWTHYVMGTKCPYKDGNIQNPCPCGVIFWSP